MDTVHRTTLHRGNHAPLSFPAAILRAALFSLFLIAALLFLSALILCRTADPLRALIPVALTVAGIGALLGGFRAGRLLGKGGALAGIALGTLLAFLFLVVALCLAKGSLATPAIPLYIGVVLAATLGGALATRKRKRRRIR